MQRAIVIFLSLTTTTPAIASAEGTRIIDLSPTAEEGEVYDDYDDRMFNVWIDIEAFKPPIDHVTRITGWRQDVYEEDGFVAMDCWAEYEFVLEPIDRIIEPIAGILPFEDMDGEMRHFDYVLVDEQTCETLVDLTN